LITSSPKIRCVEMFWFAPVSKTTKFTYWAVPGITTNGWRKIGRYFLGSGYWTSQRLQP
jgi:hypothetical protein